jgi:ADP-ribose pyrophosphatase YjhB (NUDIX family)
MSDKIPDVLAGLVPPSKFNPDAGWETTPRDEQDNWASDVFAPSDQELDESDVTDWSGMYSREHWSPRKVYTPPAPKFSHWIECPAHKGQHHWGAYGAAGLMVFTRIRRTAYVLLALRAKGVQSGGSWSGTIGGAIEKGETAWQAAQREAHEEVAGLDLGTSPGSVIYTCECGWSYTTFAVIANKSNGMLPDVTVAKGHSSWETDAVAWVRAEDVMLWPALHYRFAQAWTALRKFTR